MTSVQSEVIKMNIKRINQSNWWSRIWQLNLFSNYSCYLNIDRAHIHYSWSEGLEDQMNLPWVIHCGWTGLDFDDVGVISARDGFSLYWFGHVNVFSSRNIILIFELQCIIRTIIQTNFSPTEIAKMLAVQRLLKTITMFSKNRRVCYTCIVFCCDVVKQ